MNTQGSTHWDGLRHFPYSSTKQFYNGVSQDEISGPNASDKIGIQSKYLHPHSISFPAHDTERVQPQRPIRTTSTNQFPSPSNRHSKQPHNHTWRSPRLARLHPAPLPPIPQRFHLPRHPPYRPTSPRPRTKHNLRTRRHPPHPHRLDSTIPLPLSNLTILPGRPRRPRLHWHRSHRGLDQMALGEPIRRRGQ